MRGFPRDFLEVVTESFDPPGIPTFGAVVGSGGGGVVSAARGSSS